MWVVTRVQMRVYDRPDPSSFEQALAALVEAEANACPVCKAVLEATGALPAHCLKCGRVRSIAWQARVEELASREVASRKAKGKQI